MKYHGDINSSKLIGVRLGDPMDLHFKWFFNSESQGESMVITLNHGDIYIMSEKATGFDCKQKKNPYLKHAVGSTNFTTIKNKKPIKRLNKKNIVK